MASFLPGRVRRADVIGLGAFFAIGLVLSWLVSGFVQSRMVSVAEADAGMITTLVVADELGEGDVIAPPTGRHRKELSASLERVVSGNVLGLRVRRFDGSVILSVGPSVPDKTVDPTSVMPKAFEGRPQSEIVLGTGQRLLASYIPLQVYGSTGELDAVVEVYQDYGALAGDFRLLERGIIIVTMLALAGLYLILLRAWRSEPPTPMALARPIRAPRSVVDADGVADLS